ncbi:MAG: chromosome segregation protein SMC [Clostridiales bacterium]|nr:chromosome segregation protein SMC [Clostridiales bacterium]
MYLKSLELSGFKSFPDKTVVHFGAGLTSIVGPNGSGKSNIADAIRWVLGEQSTKTLRGAKMEDVIFGGTGKRGPMGFAEVSLVFDNSERILNIDYTEVSITRRYYRSGESEFFINRTSVRLRDIHELFMDTGLGRDGYSIIGQGRIDEILSVKSDERREIFEEAAGITKYRYRRDESERKLAACDENLVRVNDIIETLKSQVEPLREQAETAKKFLNLRDELRVLEVSTWLDSLDKLKTGLIKSRTDYDNAVRQLDSSKEELDRLYQETEELSEVMHEKDAEIERIRTELNEIEAQSASIDSDLAVLKTNHKNNLDNLSRIENEIFDQSGREGGLKAQIDARRTRIEEILKSEQETESLLNKAMQKVQEAAAITGDIETQIDALKAKKQQELDEAAKFEKVHLLSESTKNELQNRKKTLEDELSKKNEELSQEQKKADELNKELIENRDKLESLMNSIKGFELKIKSREKKVFECRESDGQARNRLDSMRNRLQMLTDMEREYEGFSKAVKMVMQQKEHGALKNIHGPISRLIRTSEKYTLAIEVALVGAMQNIVVDREEDAKTAIGYLKSGDFGRATFLPLSAIRGQELKEEGLFSEDGYLGLGNELCQFDSKYTEIIKSLLGRTVIVNHIDTAIRMARKYHHRFKIVTLDGQVMNAGGAMTGGSAGINTGMLSRAAEINRLSETMKKLESERKETQHHLSEAERELSSVLYDIDLIKADKRVAEDAVLRLESVLSQHNALLMSMNGALSLLLSEQEQLTVRIEKTENEISESVKKAQESSQNAEEINNKIEELVSGQSELLNKQGSISEQIAQYRSEKMKFVTERETLTSAASELSDLYSKLTEDRKRREELIEDLNARNAEILTQMSEKELIKTACIDNAQKKKDIIKQINAEKLNIEGERVKKEKENQAKNREMLNLEQERSRLESQKTQAEMEERQILERLWENYELTQLTAQAVRIELENTAKTNRRIADLRSEIKKLGTVNIGAIEEYSRINERYEFMTSQRDDLDKAKKELMKIISEIIDNMKEIFSKQFEMINKSFDVTFREIFGGGSAELQFDDPEDILNCGIEIKVSLPGKTLKTITLLSGGEKVFVAIALYFSILKVRPAPFCVLDEIEAALDDVNVSRFASYIKKLCDKTQFITITHRRGTMEVSDILYGVTMQERGVSKLLALNISDVEQKLSMKLK